MGFDDFKGRWIQLEKENGLSLSSWACLPEGEFSFLRPDEWEFLRQSGLPQSNCGFSFEEIEKAMPRVDEVYGPHDKKLWARIGRENLATFRMLGQDGSGNPLVLHIESREIWLLDHESSFAPYSLVNSSLAALAESLLLMEQKQCQEAEVDLEEMQQQLYLIDPRAAREGAFWHGYVEDFNDLM